MTAAQEISTHELAVAISLQLISWLSLRLVMMHTCAVDHCDPALDPEDRRMQNAYVRLTDASHG